MTHIKLKDQLVKYVTSKIFTDKRYHTKINSILTIDSPGSAVLCSAREGMKMVHKHNTIEAIVSDLNASEAVYRGWRYEGASIALSFHDFITPWSSHIWKDLYEHTETKNPLIMLAGLGISLSRFERFIDVNDYSKRFNLLENMLIFDGYGMVSSIFKPLNNMHDISIPTYLPDTYRMFYFSGVGRSIWLRYSGDFHKMSGYINQFPTEYRSSIWHGIGFAFGYVSRVQYDPTALSIIKALPQDVQANIAYGLMWAIKFDDLDQFDSDKMSIICESIFHTRPTPCLTLLNDALEEFPYESMNLNDFTDWKNSLLSTITSDFLKEPMPSEKNGLILK